MDIWRLLAAAIRRWYILVPLVAATAVFALFGQIGQPEYTTDGVLVVVPSTATAGAPGERADGGNPFESLEFSATVLSYVMNGSAIKIDYAERDLSDDYTISAQSRSPILTFEVRGTSAEQALATGQALIETARQELQLRQSAAGVPADEFVTVDVLDEPIVVDSAVSGRIQAVAAVGIAGIVISFLLTVLIDDLLIIRQRGREQESGDGEPPTDGVAPGDGPSDHARPEHSNGQLPGPVDPRPTSPTRP